MEFCADSISVNMIFNFLNILAQYQEANIQTNTLLWNV